MADALTPNFYAANENRPYPVDDAATWCDDSGAFAPTDVLVDAQLAFPAAPGAAAAVLALTVSPSLVTVVFGVAGAGHAPLAAVSLPAPVTPYQAYPVQALAPGVGGWVVFGAGALRPYSGRFFTAAQGRLLARCARPYAALPVSSVRQEQFAASLQGLVALLAGPDIEVVQETHVLWTDPSTPSAPTPVIVIRLKDSLDQNVFQLYAGSCQHRPESGNCAQTPLRTINDVGPDCNGNIDIDFQALVATATDGGITLALATSLEHVCGDDGLPSSTGSLPNDYLDRCAGMASSLDSSRGD
jgi:hypothetical protein